MSAMLHHTRMDGRCLQARPMATPSHKRVYRGVRRTVFKCESSLGPQRLTSEGLSGRGAPAADQPEAARSGAHWGVRMRGGLASAALAACLALQPPAAVALPVLAADGGFLGPEAAAAAAAEAGEGAAVGGVAGGGSAALQTVYFGNGCFWGRQKDFVDVEIKDLGRKPEQLTALVGYAAGTQTGPGGKVCYVYSDPRTHYDTLGHAEVVQLGVSTDPRVAEGEMRAFAARYFEQFKKTPFGMQRSDPQDRGPAYRNVIGIPGGVSSPLFHIIQEENKYGMELREGRGNVMGWRGPTEDDILNTVWLVDSTQLPFYRAERFHQFHNGLGKVFPAEYVRDLRNLVAGLGRIEPTGCPELPF